MPLRSLGREVAFWLRGHLRWAPAPRPRQPRSLEREFAGMDAAARYRAEQLSAQHTVIREWSRWLNAVEVREGLYLLDVLPRMVSPSLVGSAGARAALDVGSKNGSHLPALHALCPCPWTLIELDAHRRYGNLVTRRSRGEAIAAAHAGCRYLAGPVQQLRPNGDRFDLITWTLPFVFAEPLAAWGLPDRFFQPEALLRHVLSLLSPAGALVILNQGEAERDEQRRLLATAGVGGARIQPFGPLDSPLSNFRRTRWGWRVSAA